MGGVLILCLEKIRVLSGQDFFELKCKKILEAAGMEMPDVWFNKVDYLVL